MLVIVVGAIFELSSLAWFLKAQVFPLLPSSAIIYCEHNFKHGSTSVTLSFFGVVNFFNGVVNS